MTTSQIILLIIGILVLNVSIWFAISRWINRRIEIIKSKLLEEYCSGPVGFIIEPKSAIYRGADTRFGNIKGNGVICLTEKSLIFNKITGQKIEIHQEEIKDAIVEESFKGMISLATGGKHLVIKTKDGNRVGFLVRDAEVWSEKIRAL